VIPLSCFELFSGKSASWVDVVCKLADSLALLVARCVSLCAGSGHTDDEALAGRFHHFFRHGVQPIEGQEPPDLGKEALQ
jgi:hypothetical protein